ncbi:MAG: hypothetical protein ACKO5K_01400 [Armatimonadota bacterium]
MDQTASHEIAIPLDQLLERHAAGEIAAEIVHDALRRRGQEIVEEFRRRRRGTTGHIPTSGPAFAGGLR